VTADNFSVRWTGQLKPIVTGAHTFSTTADDGIRLWVNNQLVIDNWVDQSATTKSSAAIQLTAGVLYPIKIEYYEHTGSATARLMWAYPGQTQIVVPQLQLYLPAPATNQPPIVNAGPDQTIALPASASLSGTVTDDGLPSGAVVSASWSQMSGPGTVTFANASAPVTTATFSTSGTYVLRLTASDTALSASDDITIVVNPVPPPSTSGLSAQYFNDPGTGTHFVTPVLTRVDSTVNFTWGTAAPASGVQADNFSVRWTGQVQAPVSGSYRFTTIADDGVRLWVNGQQVVNNWTDQNATTTTSSAVSLTAGVKYTITLEYYEHTGQATARLQWSYPGQSTQVIPQSRLFH
jgi:hypothetical protein